MKIACVYDWMDRWGGAERLLLTIHTLFPDADWYTSYVDASLDWHKELHPKTSFIQRLPDFIKRNRIRSTPLYPYAFESFDFTGYDIVFSISSFFSKGIITRPETKHISYVLSPSRMLWGDSSKLYINTFIGKIGKPYVNHLKEWDYIAAQRPDVMLALSASVKHKIKTYYHRNADVIHPPFDYDYWERIKSNHRLSLSPHEESDPYFLIVSRLEPYKRIDLAIQTFNELGVTLKIVGKGRLQNTLKSISRHNIEFVNEVSDESLVKLYSDAQALIMTQEEDFGYTALEAIMCGCPVIAYSKGGATETIKSDVTGLFFNEQQPSSLKATIEKFRSVSYTLQELTAKHGETEVKKFSIDHFYNQITQYI